MTMPNSVMRRWAAWRMTPAAKPSAARKLYILIEGDGSRCVYARSRAGAIQRAQEWITSTVLADHKETLGA